MQLLAYLATVALQSTSPSPSLSAAAIGSGTICNLISCIAWLMRWGAAKYAISKESAQMCLTKNKSFRWEQCEGDREGQEGSERRRHASFVPLPHCPRLLLVSQGSGLETMRDIQATLLPKLFTTHMSPLTVASAFFSPPSLASPSLPLSLVPSQPRLLSSTYSHCHLFAAQQL